MKTSDLREMSDEQLVATLNEAQEALFRLRVRAGTEKLDAPTELKKQRRLIARVKTLLGERAKAESPASEAAE